VDFARGDDWVYAVAGPFYQVLAVQISHNTKKDFELTSVPFLRKRGGVKG
jgi:hypothetical protein